MKTSDSIAGRKEENRRLASLLVRAAHEAGMTFATAESCTGGLIGGTVTAVSGASQVFQGGVISYANRVKQEVLGVPANILAAEGAVSAPSARAMAEGVRRLTHADLAVAVTGIAGPGGGTPEKPVGLVYFGIAGPGTQVRSERHIFGGDRDEVREQTVHTALSLLLSALS